MNDPSLYYTPPNDIEMEKQVLATCLLNLKDAIEACDILNPLDFYKTAHQLIFKRIADHVSKKLPVDLPSISSSLKDNNELERVGGSAYLASLVDGIPVVPDLGHYCGLVRKKKQLRQLIEICNTGAKGAYASDYEIIDKIQHQVSDLAMGQREKGFKHISEIIEETLDRCENLSKNCGITGVPSGYPDLDFLTCGFQPSDLVIIAGRPGMGKTALALNLMKNQSRKNFKVAFFSLEMANPQIGNRLASMISLIDGNKFRSGRFRSDEWECLSNAADHIASWNLYVDDTAKLSYQSLIRRAKSLKGQVGLDVVYIDYLGFLDGDKDLGRRDLEVGSITRNLKAFAKDSNIPVVLLVQLSRKCEERSNKRPILSDLRDSGDIEQDADLVMFVYRDEMYNEKSKHIGEAEVLVRKQRNGSTGPVLLKWIGKNTRFESIERDREK